MSSVKKIGTSLMLLSTFVENPSVASSQATSIHDLPKEMLVEIFSKLNVQDLKSAAQVSKQFNAVACDLLTKERDAAAARKREREDAEMREAVNTFCSLNTPGSNEDELIKAAKKALSINSASADAKLVEAKLEAIGVLYWGISQTQEEDFKNRDLYITLWDNNTFPNKDKFKRARDADYNTLVSYANNETTFLSPPSAETLKILEKYKNKKYVE